MYWKGLYLTVCLQPATMKRNLMTIPVYYWLSRCKGSWIYDVYTQGIAYSERGTLDGPWIQEKDPITPPNYGHGMLFHTLYNKLLMAIHSHKNINGRYYRVPHLFEVYLSGDKLTIGKPYKP
jgi:hypothetical protein